MLAMEIMNTFYPELNWLRIFPDWEFFLPDQPNACAVVSFNIFASYNPVGTSRTAFDGENDAICVAL